MVSPSRTPKPTPSIVPETQVALTALDQQISPLAVNINTLFPNPSAVTPEQRTFFVAKLAELKADPGQETVLQNPLLLKSLLLDAWRQQTQGTTTEVENKQATHINEQSVERDSFKQRQKQQEYLQAQQSLNDRMAALLEQTNGDKLKALDLALADQNLPDDHRQQLTMLREKLILILGSGTNEVENQVLADLIQECPIDFSAPEPNVAFGFFVTSLGQAEGVSVETKITIKAHLGIATDLQTGTAVLDRLTEPGQGDSPKYTQDNPLTIRAGVKAFSVPGKEHHYIIQTAGLPNLEVTDTTLGLTDQLRFALLWQRLQKHGIDRFLASHNDDPGLVAQDFCLKLYDKLLPITDSTLPEEEDLVLFDQIFSTITQNDPKHAEIHMAELGLLDETGMLNQALVLELVSHVRVHPDGVDLTFEEYKIWLKNQFDKSS